MNVDGDEAFERLRRSEFSRLDEQGIAYLDYAASALYGESQVAEYAEKLLRGVFGNPHSEHGPSRASEAELERARAATLAFFDADPDVYDVCFTANTSMAIKLVAESYPFGAGCDLILSADNHNSMNGIREYARNAGARTHVIPLDEDLRLAAPEDFLSTIAASGSRGLFGFPGQSNFSGVKHPLELIHRAQSLGFDVLLDAAGVGCGTPISLRRHPAEFLVFSFYKIFGLPTGVGALVARRDALEKLRRPWFAGGTVDFVSIEHDRHQLQSGHGGFEDGTPNFLNLGSVVSGFEFMRQVDRAALQRRLDRFTARFIYCASALRNRDGTPLVKVYGPVTSDGRGATIALNVLNADGSTIPYRTVEARAREAGVAVRGGCFCNPGAAEHAFEFRRFDIARALDELRCGFTPDRLQTCLGPGATVGAIRISMGLPTVEDDIHRVLGVIDSFADSKEGVFDSDNGNCSRGPHSTSSSSRASSPRS